MSLTPSPRLQRSLAIADRYLEPIVNLTIELTEIPAPTFNELNRARALQAHLEKMGYDEVSVDDIGNVTARIPGRDPSKSLLVAAHIDTVFPRDVDLKVTRTEATLQGQAVGDNTVSVASVAHLKQAFDELGEAPAIDIVIAGNVGEEGLGDLRGMKEVVGSLSNLAGAIAVEGHFLGRVTHIAVGSRRYRVKVTGLGGHSFAAAGTPSAIHHLAELIAECNKIPLPKDPKTSFNAGTFHAGVSVNTIAPEAESLFDMRSVSAEALESLVAEVDRILASPTPHGIEVHVETVGDRAAGSYPADGVLVQIADRIVRELGMEPLHSAGSTDANVPIGLGIPAICIGITTGEHMHREDEYINIDPIPTGFAHLVTVILESAEALASQ